MATDTSNIEDIYPLSPLQEGILYHSLLDDSGKMYFEQFDYEISGPLDRQALRRAWARVLGRHAALRSVPIWDRPGDFVQAVLKRVDLEWEEHDWRPIAADSQGQQLELFLRSDRERGFDLSTPPLFRLALIQTGDYHYHLVWSYHHLLLDGWSASIVLQEVAEIYEADAKGREPVLRVRRPFRDYVLWLRMQDQSEAGEFWRRTLEGLDSPALLPKAQRRPSEIESGSHAESLLLPAAETQALESFARANGLTVSTIWLGAWALLLSKYLATREVLFGVTVAGRPADLDGVEDMVGMFINTIPLRVTLRPEDGAVEWLRSLQSAIAAYRRYEHCPLAYIQRKSGLAAGVPIFDTLVVIENYPSSPGQTGPDYGLSISRSFAFEQTNYPLTVEIGPGKKTHVQLIYDACQFDAETVRGMLQRYVFLVGWLIARPGRISEYCLGAGWNSAPSGARAVATGGRCIYDMFEEQVLRTPDAVAVRHETGLVSFAELYRRANRLGTYLMRNGAAPEARVGICLSRAPRMIEAILGIFASGAAYVPLDPDWPADRLYRVLEDLGISLLVTERAILPTLPKTTARVLWLEEAALQIDAESWFRPKSGIEPSNLAYVLCTSGSTGTPKGVAIEQSNTVALLDWGRDAFSPEELALVAFSSSLSFDLSVFEILVPLVAGGSIVIMPNALRLGSDEEAGAITLINTVPSALAEVLHLTALPASVRTVALAGEALPNSLVQAVYRNAEVRRVVNLYGPTEDTTYSTMAEVEKGATTEPLIGQPITFKSASVLDWAMQPVPAGVTGDLYLCGAGLARGYQNQPGLTAEHFVPFPGPGEVGQRFYRTGDLVRFHPGGLIEYLGRRDQQVKLRGFRIELGEIESRLAMHPAVAQSAVIVQEGEAGKRLIAFVLLKQGRSASMAELRAHLAAELPHYMLPAQVVALDAFPLLPSGKLDRKALAQWSPPRTAPLTEKQVGLVKTVVTSIWSQLLGLQAVDDQATFFEQGGHSLLACKLISRLRAAFGVDLTLRTVFEAATVNGISDHIAGALRAGKRVATGPVAAARNGEAPCSFAQQRIWLHEQLKPQSPSYNVVNAMQFTGTLDIGALERGLTELARRHHILRTSISESLPLRQIVHPTAQIRLPLTETTDDAEDLQARIADFALRPFDLHEGPLMRGHLFRLGAEDHVLVLALHHLICDGWSLGILARDLSTLYNAEVEGLSSPLPELSAQYADFAHWQREWLSGAVLEEHLAYWRDQLKPPLPELTLPGTRQRPPEASGLGGRLVSLLPQELSDKLHELARRRGLTPFIFMAAALEVLLHCYTDATDVCIGADINNRDRSEFEDVAGLFVNQVVLRGDLSGDPTFLQVAEQARERLIAAFVYSHLPFEKVVEELNKSGRKNHTPLFPIKLIVQNAPQHAVELLGLHISPLPTPHLGAIIDCGLIVNETVEGMHLILEYDADLFEATAMRRLLSHFHTLLSQIMADPLRRISSLSILSSSDSDGLGPETFANANLSRREFERIWETINKTTF